MLSIIVSMTSTSIPMTVYLEIVGMPSLSIRHTLLSTLHCLSTTLYSYIDRSCSCHRGVVGCIYRWCIGHSDGREWWWSVSQIGIDIGWSRICGGSLRIWPGECIVGRGRGESVERECCCAVPLQSLYRIVFCLLFIWWVDVWEWVVPDRDSWRICYSSLSSIILIYSLSSSPSSSLSIYISMSVSSMSMHLLDHSTHQ